jgi:hypothetical protein
MKRMLHKLLVTVVIVSAAATSHAQTFMEMFDGENLSVFHVSVGASGGSLKNESFDQYIDSYNEVNQSVLKEDFNHFRWVSGYEIGVRWTIMEFGMGGYDGFKQERVVTPIRSRVMDFKIRYFNALASFPMGKERFVFSIGLQAVRSVFSASLLYNNGATSFGKESGLNGNYKGLGANGLLRLEGMIVKTEQHAVGISATFTGAIAGAGGNWTDNNAAKSGILVNSVTSTEVKTSFTGWSIGLNYHYSLGK